MIRLPKPITTKCRKNFREFLWPNRERSFLLPVFTLKRSIELYGENYEEYVKNNIDPSKNRRNKKP